MGEAGAVQRLLRPVSAELKDALCLPDTHCVGQLLCTERSYLYALAQAGKKGCPSSL